MLERIKMLERINMCGTRTQEKAHRIYIACRDHGRSEQDLLHRFIGQLKLLNFQIEKVNVQENPHCAMVVLESPQDPHVDSRSFSSLFKRKRHTSESQLTLNFDLYKLDEKGLNFFMDYKFERRCRQAAHDTETDFAGTVHTMIQTAFEGSRSFSISPMPDVEII